MSQVASQVNDRNGSMLHIESLPTVRLMGVRFHAVMMQEMLDLMMESLRCRRGGWVVTPNLDILRRAVHNRSFCDVISGADLVVADGMPLIWAARLQGTPLPERVAGSSLLTPLAERAAAEQRSVYFLGGDPGTAERAAEVLRMKFPKLKVAGCICPPLGFESDSDYMAKLRQALQDASPDIVCVALGSPKQDRLIALLRDEWPCTWWIGVGISFSFLAGTVRRAPEWMQRIGLEWLHRLAHEPHRLARRYLVDGVPFAVRLLIHSARQHASHPQKVN